MSLVFLSKKQQWKLIARDLNKTACKQLSIWPKSHHSLAIQHLLYTTLMVMTATKRPVPLPEVGEAIQVAYFGSKLVMRSLHYL